MQQIVRLRIAHCFSVHRREVQCQSFDILNNIGFGDVFKGASFHSDIAQWSLLGTAQALPISNYLEILPAAAAPVLAVSLKTRLRFMKAPIDF
jgi:hypothetical protein